MKTIQINSANLKPNDLIPHKKLTARTRMMTGALAVIGWVFAAPAQPSPELVAQRTTEVPTNVLNALKGLDPASLQRLVAIVTATSSSSAPTEVAQAPALSSPAAPQDTTLASPPAIIQHSPVLRTFSEGGSSTNALASAPPTNAPPAPDAVTVQSGANGVLLNFKDAPLNLVLDKLSDAAGFIINKVTEVRGTVTITSKLPVTRDEAVELLNSNLKKNGYAVIRNGRILTIIDIGNIAKANLDITVPYNPDEIPDSDEVETAILHIRYASAPQLVPSLEQLLPTSDTVIANEAANTILLIATKTDIKRMLKIINALDSSIAMVSSIKVIPLKYADAKDTATLITQLFATQSGTGSTGGPGGFGGRGALFSMLAGGGFPGRGGGPGGPGGGDRGGGSGGGAQAVHVVAVGDDRSNSLVVSAPADLLATISEMVDRIDQPIADEVELRPFHLVHADPNELADQLAALFPDPTAANAGQNSQMPFFFGGFRRLGGGPGGAGSSQAGQSERAKKLSKVTAIADPRTRSLLVTASKTMMPQIAAMISELDADAGRPMVVQVIDLHNIDPQEAYPILQDVFMTRVPGGQQSSSASRNGMLSTQNPLTTRETQNSQQTSSTGLPAGNSMGSSLGRPTQ